jgi:ABC-type lipopolysaccharide export system ATPase subunit
MRTKIRAIKTKNKSFIRWLRYLEIKLILNNASHFVLLDEPYNGLSPLMIEKLIFYCGKMRNKRL